MADLVGRTLCDRYHVDAFIGRGGMSDVYKVWDRQRSVYLVIKVMHEDIAEDKVFLRRFKREAQTLAKLQHPNIVRYYGLGQEGRITFMLMELVEGHSLRQEIFESSGPFDMARILEIIRPVCRALNYAHTQRFVHCDVKPANILIENNGRIQISDFGIARMTESATVTMVGAGTPAYMAPEQVRGDDPTPQNDIYSLGVVLFELVTGGERPFTGEHARTTGTAGEKIRWEQANLEPPSPRKFSPGTPVALERIVLKCLDKEPQNRYSSVSEFLIDLEEAGTQASTETPNAAPPMPSSILPSAPVAQSPSIVPFQPPVQPPIPSVPVPSQIRIQTRSVVVLGILGVAIFAAALLLTPPASIVLPPSPNEVSSEGAFIANQVYFISNRDGKSEVYRLRGGQITRVTHSAGPSQSWSPVVTESGALYFTSDRQDGKAEIYRMDLGSGALSRVTNTAGSGQSWSPVVTESGALYFTSDRQDGKAEIYRMDLGSGALSRVTNTAGSGQSWSPVVTKSGALYFTSDRQDGKAEIYRMDLGSGALSRVTNTAGSGQSWSPVVTESGALYFTSDRQDGKAEIYRMDLGSGALSRVTNTAGSGQSWSPVVTESGALYFTSDRQDGKAEIYRMDLHNGQVMRLTNTPGGAESWQGGPSREPESDGRMVASKELPSDVPVAPSNTPIPSPVSQPASTSTPENPCLSWDEITTSLSGQTVCMYGRIAAITASRQVATRYQFSTKRGTFFLYSQHYGWYDPNNGKSLSVGTCIMITGTIQTIQGVPYIDIEAGKDFNFRDSCR